MRRIALVVQRCHPRAIGGSEALAWQYARLLSSRFAVDILTSTAIDHARWSNELAPGPEVVDGITIRRFPVAITRGDYWNALYHRMLDAVGGTERKPAGTRWREALQEEFLRFQGPYCPDLERWLRHHDGDYAAVVFFTYLYPTSYFGVAAVPSGKAVLVPTLHDEPPAHLRVLAARYAPVARRIWLSEAEQRIAKRVLGYDEGDIVGMALEHTDPAAPEVRERPYFLYCGRIEKGKGCDRLFEAFEALSNREEMTLVLTGAAHLTLPRSRSIEYLGFVDETRKYALMAGARAFIMPSRWESFSIATLEAMAQGAPVLADQACEVVRDHVQRSGGGWLYGSLEDMVEKMRAAAALPREDRAAIGAAGRAYVLDRFDATRVRERLCDIIDSVASSAQGARA